MSFQSALIHISDLETGPNNRADPEDRGLIDARAYEADADELVADVRHVLKGRADGCPLGLIISGDIASKGGAYDRCDEYAHAEKVITRIRDKLGISPERVAVVPGNHDVNWDECKAAYQAAKGKDAIESNEEHEFARRLPQKLADYAAFVQGLCGIDVTPVQPVSFPGFLELGVALVGLDSTFALTFDPADNFGVIQDVQIEHAGKQLEQLLAERPDSIPAMVVHHSLYPLQRDPEDTSFLDQAPETMRRLHEAGFRVAFCGHEHRKATIDVIDRELKLLVAGTYGVTLGMLHERYANDAERNRYQIILVDPDGMSRILYRRISLDKAEQPWINDDPKERSIKLLPATAAPIDTAKRAGVRLSVADPVQLPSNQRVLVVSVKEEPANPVKLQAAEYELQDKDGISISTISAEAEKPHLGDFRVDPGKLYTVVARFVSEDDEWTETQRIEIYD